jgi:hypothetical protein
MRGTTTEAGGTSPPVDWAGDAKILTSGERRGEPLPLNLVGLACLAASSLMRSPYGSRLRGTAGTGLQGVHGKTDLEPARFDDKVGFRRLVAASEGCDACQAVGVKRTTEHIRALTPESGLNVHI